VGDGLREAKVLPCKSCYCLPCLIKHCSSQPSDAMHEQVPARWVTMFIVRWILLSS